MSQLVVRNIEPPLVLALKQRAAKHGHSAEEEHCRILEEALKAPKRRSVLEFLASVPDVLSDEDLERLRLPAGKPAKAPKPANPQAAPAKAVKLRKAG